MQKQIAAMSRRRAPKGLALSADARTLYIADTRRRHICRFGVSSSKTLSGRELLAECDAGGFDGVRVDNRGRVWCAAHDGLHCFDQSNGKLLR